jgi:hypothetical protein
MLDPKGSGAKDYARRFLHFVFNVGASITVAVDAFGLWWANARSSEHGPTLALCNTFAPLLTLVMRMKGVTKGKLERLATGPEGPEAESLRRFKFHPIG